MDYKEKVIALLNSQELSKEQKERLEVIFPELKEKESEDERIRKALIEMIHDTTGDECEDCYHVSKESVLSWLEKQGEKTTDKIEPNPAWSEEDEEILKWLCRIIHSQRVSKEITLKEESELGEWMDKWLNHNPQAKQGNKSVNIDIESMVSSYEQRLKSQGGTKYTPLVNMCLTAFRHGVENALEELNLNKLEKQGENKTDFSNIRVWKYIVDMVLTEKDGIGNYLDNPDTERIAKKLQEKYGNIEKQGKQKPTDKTTPKFKVGDWILNNVCFPMQIASIKDSMYIFTEGDAISVSFIDENYHLWTIKDAKDGDVLYSIDSKQPFIYKERPQFSQARGYCCINKFGEFAIWNTSKCVICTDKYIPATKIQRDQLFQQMKEAGYEWDAEKKELKKIEPKILDADNELLQNYRSNITRFVNQFKKDFGL